MNLFSEMSKNIGWNGTAAIPPIAEAKQLLTKVKANDKAAFEQVFIIHRFSLLPETPEQKESMKLCFEAFSIGTNYFRSVRVNPEEL